MWKLDPIAGFGLDMDFEKSFVTSRYFAGQSNYMLRFWNFHIRASLLYLVTLYLSIFVSSFLRYNAAFCLTRSITQVIAMIRITKPITPTATPINVILGPVFSVTKWMSIGFCESFFSYVDLTDFALVTRKSFQAIASRKHANPTRTSTAIFAIFRLTLIWIWVTSQNERFHDVISK